MAQRTYLQMVSADELKQLEANPTSINQLDKSDDESTGTYYWPSLSFFACGSAYPKREDGPLAVAFAGSRSIPCPTLENGSFEVIDPEAVRAAASELTQLERADIARRLARADLDELVEEEELFDLELLIADGEDDVGDVIKEELDNIETFFTNCAETNSAIVMYTT